MDAPAEATDRHVEVRHHEIERVGLELAEREPRVVTDMREAFDDKAVDFITTATPIIEPTLHNGVSALVAAAREWLPPT